MLFGVLLGSDRGYPRLLWVNLGTGTIVRDTTLSIPVTSTSLCVFQDRLWVGGDGGVIRVDLSTFRAEALFFPPSGGKILQVTETDGGLCVLTGKSIYYMDYLGEFKCLRDIPDGIVPTRFLSPYLLVPSTKGVYDLNRGGYVYTHHKDIRDHIFGCAGDYVFVCDDEGLFGVGVETRQSVRVSGNFSALEPLYFRQPNTIGRGLVGATMAGLFLITGDPPLRTQTLPVEVSEAGTIAGLRLIV